MSTPITAMFDDDINGATATQQTLSVHVTQSGLLIDATISATGPTVRVDPLAVFFPGDLVQVTATSAIQSIATDPVDPQVWQFRTAVSAGSGQFSDSGQSLGNHDSRGVSLGDLDGDGDLDAFVSNASEGNRVWLNEEGSFIDSRQSLGEEFSGEVSLGDLDGDGDLDAFVSVINRGSRVWLNNGSGEFEDSGQNLGTSYSSGAALGDFDGDGDLDVFEASQGFFGENNANRVLVNSGSGVFTDSGQRLGNQGSRRVSVGDLDGDGDLDALVANVSGTDPANRVWLNDGAGEFVDSGQSLGVGITNDVALGDLDNDGDLDAVTANDASGQGDRTWLNDGNGSFTDSGQSLFGEHRSTDIALGDLDGDGDLDVLIATWRGYADRVLVNNGQGQFASGQSLGDHFSTAVSLGDVDGDGDLDAFITGRYDPEGNGANRVWLNQNAEPAPPSVTLSLDESTILESAGTAVVTATLSESTTALVTVDLTTSGTASASDYSLSAPQIVIPAGSTAGSITVTALDDDLNELRETVVVEVTRVTNATELGSQQVSLTIIDDDGPIVVGTAPARNSLDASANENITATFDVAIDGSTASPQSFVVHGAHSGRLLGSAATVRTSGAAVTFDSTADFYPGELVQAGITAALESSDGEMVTPYVWQFRTAVPGGSGQFGDSGQLLDDQGSWSLSLGDLDGDGDLDAFVGNAARELSPGNSVWLNVGGLFSDTGQVLGMGNSLAVPLGDLDGDGDLDAFVSNVDGGVDRVWFNDGMGRFADSGQSLGNHDSSGAALGDLDGDGDLDAFVVTLNQGSRVWLNEGGQFTSSGQLLNGLTSNDVSLGDVDGDGDLDAFVVNGDQPNRVWLNDGYASFGDSGQDLGNHRSTSVEMGDLDGDGDLDAFVGNYGEPNRVWLNNAGRFSESGQMLGDHKTLVGMALGDLDGDGDLDAFAGNSDHEPDRVWMNNGNAEFVVSEQPLGDHESRGVALGDLDGDGDLDVFVADNVGGRVWLNDEEHLDSLRVTKFQTNPSGFDLEFNREFDPSVLNVFDLPETGMGMSDVTVSGLSSGLISGNLLLSSSQRSSTFVKSGEPLEPDTYTVTLRSATDGWKDLEGELLAVGSDTVFAFTVLEPVPDSIILSAPDFARGPGQEINIPADTGAGIPLSISNGVNVRAIDAIIGYDPATLEITGAAVAPGLPPGASATLTIVTPGLAILVFSSPTALAPGASNFVNLQAIVPSVGASEVYGTQRVLDLRGVTIRDGNDNEFPVIVDDGMHLVSYLADVSGNQRINASDAAQVARVAALIDAGFAAIPLTDPGIVGDISGNGRVNAADASLVARFAALIDVPEIPPIPSAVAASSTDPGWIGSLAVPARQDETQEHTETNLEEQSNSAIGWDRFPNHVAGVDAFIEDRPESAVSAAEEEAALVFEEALDELFAGLDEYELLSG